MRQSIFRMLNFRVRIEELDFVHGENRSPTKINQGAAASKPPN